MLEEHPKKREKEMTNLILSLERLKRKKKGTDFVQNLHVLFEGRAESSKI